MEKAIPLFEIAVEKMQGCKHNELIEASSDLALAYRENQQIDKAVRLMRDMIDRVRPTDAVRSQHFTRLLEALGLCLFDQQRPAEAEPSLRECLAIRERVSPNDWWTFDVQSIVGGALLGLKQYDEAESLLLAGYRGLREREVQIADPPRTIRLKQAVERLINPYDATNKSDEAERWRKELGMLKTVNSPQAAQLPKVEPSSGNP